MAIYKGNKKVVAVYKGSTPINKIYKGSTLVFQRVVVVEALIYLKVQPRETLA